MRYVSASDAKQRFAALLDTVQREPVTIRRQNHEVAVVISSTDFKRLTSNNVEVFRRFCNRVSARAKARGLTQEKPGAY
ncbi:MAG: type II toxin-antitoxin system Phd/YefM family antitoxin [Gammaproteobacteria bacterium]|nr:type II toxin-antitoxin system Phd/YefM family antitoxin [Gammaproteobacteria bacterium]